MPLARLSHSDFIAVRLNLLSAIMKTRTHANLTDANRILETVVKRFFNALFGWKLKNLNLEEHNYPAVDLGDFNQRLAIQVTNQGSSGKISATQAKAFDHKLGRRFDRLIVFFLLPKKPGFPRDFKHKRGTPRIDTWDISGLLTQISEMDDLNSLEAAAAILSEEMTGFDVPASPQFASGFGGPFLVAQFHEHNGKLCPVYSKKDKHDDCPEYRMDLWVKGAPSATHHVNFEILDKGIRDNPWTIKRKKHSIRAQRFLTDDMSLWGDVAILAQGCAQDGSELWYLETTLYQSLVRYYGEKPADPKIRPALKQILEN